MAFREVEKEHLTKVSQESAKLEAKRAAVVRLRGHTATTDPG